jgi:pimeloyl-ACP methyl ester carboxylesterase
LTTVLLIHGGLWEDMDARRFWHQPGIVAGLTRHGVEVLAPDRRHRAPDWAAETAHIAAALPDRPVTVLAGSNGCSVAVRLALARPGSVERLLLAWPVTAGDPGVDARTRNGMAERGAPPRVIDALLAGQTVRGSTDAELAGVTQPVGLLPSVPENPLHQRRTIDALHRLLPHSVVLAGCPEPPRPDFLPHAEAFVRTAVGFVAT